ncbi:MerR family transcriptional regulator [Donghicola mangrovi]|uniref:Helix-turn-helix domain-containing protein n=1 Tax=Donghicola mangrovi TaxID=2729614 RepID=A0A850QDX8_9RHOB|nr:helix-turn-helix domain-containing protein [Donghicola mangrovi]NVO24625.1 helix-turn-helix domain-containing protein [Donghicola mangrovi]
MFTIGKLSKATGVKVPTIRYYEQIGLLPEPDRSAGNQRLYGAETRETLSFVRHARDLGFPIEAIRELLVLARHPSASCADADEIARRQLAEVRARIARLSQLAEELERMVHHGAHGTVAECRVLEVIADHSECAHHDHPAD